MEVGTWSVKGDQLCIEYSSAYSSMGAIDSCVDFEFSNDGNTLTMTQSGVPVTLTKK